MFCCTSPWTPSRSLGCRYPPMSDQKLRQLKQLGTRRAVPPWLTAGLWPFLLGILFTSLLVWITNLLIH
ncbi:hypothetical protein M3Y99_01584000 [Aphelenchoides fujianensis]|nr:hypothetical protein M3Y99_01584000 [Aphelenchoides fujianensis]